MRNETCAVRIVICAMRKNFTMRILSRTARARRLFAAHEGPTLMDYFHFWVADRKAKLIIQVMDLMDDLESAEKSIDLKDGLVQLASPLMSTGGCSVKVDNATGFKSLKDDKYLKEIGHLFLRTRYE